MAIISSLINPRDPPFRYDYPITFSVIIHLSYPMQLFNMVVTFEGNLATISYRLINHVVDLLLGMTKSFLMRFKMFFCFHYLNFVSSQLAF